MKNLQFLIIMIFIIGSIVGNGVVYAQYGLPPSEQAEQAAILQQALLGSPLKQFKSGTLAQNVKCNNDFVLVIKWEDSSPACITPLDAKVLYERGWTWSATPDKSLGIMARVLYGTNGLMPCLDNCTKHFSLNIETTSKSYLLGYAICDGSSCTKDSLQSHQTPNLQNNFLTVPLPDELNSKWKVGDVVDIKVLISPIFDNSNSTFLDLGNSTILATGLVGI